MEGVMEARRKKKVMVAEEEEHCILLATEELMEEGYEIVSTNSGFRLVQFIEEKDPDILILDLKFGEYSGLDLIPEIKNVFPNLPVIIWTAYDTSEREAIAAGADEFVVKSFDLFEMKDKISKLLELHL